MSESFSSIYPLFIFYLEITCGEQNEIYEKMNDYNYNTIELRVSGLDKQDFLPHIHAQKFLRNHFLPVLFMLLVEYQREQQELFFEVISFY